jgi:hypothetical protein
VTLESFLESDFSGAGTFEPFLGTRVGFNLWHFIMLFQLHPDGVPLRRELMEPVGQYGFQIYRKRFSLKERKGRSFY